MKIEGKIPLNPAYARELAEIEGKIPPNPACAWGLAEREVAARIARYY